MIQDSPALYQEIGHYKKPLQVRLALTSILSPLHSAGNFPDRNISMIIGNIIGFKDFSQHFLLEQSVTKQTYRERTARNVRSYEDQNTTKNAHETHKNR